MNRDDALKKSDDALQELAQALEQGASDQLVRYLEMLSKFHRYSFCNCMLIALQKPDATHVAGFQRWKSLGRFVKKGEAGIGILAPLLFRGQKKEQQSSDEGHEPKERSAPTIRGFRVVHVFDVSQTEGKDLAEFAALGGDPGEKILRLGEIIRSHGIALEFAESLGGANGVSEGGKIQVVQSLPAAQKFSTMCHELAHELLHRGDRRTATTRSVRETEAESVAFVVCRANGLDCSTRASDYIRLWDGDEKVLMQSLELIRDVATRILTQLDATQATEEQAQEEVSHVA